jgi:hypothetical protein
MGQIYQPRLQEFGATGVPIPSARLYTFDPVATTTPKATYSDNDLLVSNGAYVQADAAGVFPQIFAANGEAFYASLRTAAGVEVQQFQFLTALGSDDASSLLRDFTTNGRFQVRGSGGIVQIEVGDPSGDDIGGDGRIGGWEGTQGGSLGLDFAEVEGTGFSDFPVVKRAGVTEWVPRLLIAGTASAVSELILPLDDTFECWELQLRNIKNTAATLTQAVLSFDGGATYKNTLGDYTDHGIAQHNSGADPRVAYDRAQMNLMTADTGTTGHTDVVMKLFSKAAAETRALVTFIQDDPASAANTKSGLFSNSTNNKNWGKATHLKIITNMSTATFDYRLIGWP